MDSTRKKIMMVDDDLVILKMGKHMLMDDYDVFPLPSAAKLFSMLEKVTPDLILLDVYMPETDGIETIKRLKADDRYAGIPVVFVSSADDEQSAINYKELGAYANLSKPYTADEIHNCIENCLSAHTPDAQKTIVAVDDAPEILIIVQELLHDTYKIHTLKDPTKLESLLYSVSPDLFLIDYIMPTLSGTELIPIIRKFPEHKDTPIIFLTSEKSPVFLKEAVRLGASDFIIKPINKKILKEKIAQHI